ncbi:c-type cytochrome [Methylohalobius crimeensis]|uniref:c-type cytochrome n=1 Tax=Methylohalobius crimeensis TaxID=244365 RepID=UPI0003B68321|nr:cytochrome c [Methylohalobius crimeensis]
MKHQALWAGILGAAVLTMGQAAVAAGDPEAGKAKFYTCQGCHSIPGYTNAYPTYHVPKIGGQNEAYVISALKAYKDGSRTHGSMQGNAGSLSEQDMADLAAYVAQFGSNKRSGPITGDPVAGKALTEKCASCHGEDGNPPAPNFPRFAGQYESYLINSLLSYQSGKRKHPIMQAMVQGLSEEDIRNLAAYYASQAGLGIVERD